MSSPIQQAGGQMSKPAKYAPIFTNRWITGLWTQRSALRDAATTYLYEKFYSGSRFESLIDGSNCELTNRLTLARRPGNSIYNVNVFSSISKFYSFRQFSATSENISVIADTLNNVVDCTVTGSAANATVLFHKTTTSPAYFQGVGNVLYFGDSVEQIKYYLSTNQLPVTQLWGIANTQASFGPLPPTVASQTGPGLPWSNVPNLLTTGGSLASIAIPATIGAGAPGASQNLLAQTFTGLVVPSGSFVSGLQIQLNLQNTGGASAYFYRGWAGAVMYIYNGLTNTFIAAKDLPNNPNTSIVTIGGPNDNWGQNLFPSDLNNLQVVIWTQGQVNTTVIPGSVTSGTFIQFESVLGTLPFGTIPFLGATTAQACSSGQQLTVTGVSNTSNVSGTVWRGQDSGAIYTQVGSRALGGSTIVAANNIQAQIFTGFATTAVVVGIGAGSLSTTNGGWKYEACYGNNSITPTVLSSPTRPSTVTGNIPLFTSVNVQLFASNDPQVNQIHVYRTLDGGPIYFELPNSPFANATTTISDSSPDSTLNIFSQAPNQQQNNPPPTGFINCTYHLGRVWGSVANSVYFSVGPDIINGNPNEAFPPANVFVFPSRVVRLLPNGQSGLIVFTTSDVYIIPGTTTASFYSVPFVPRLGLLSYNAVSVNGNIIYMQSADGHVLSFDPTSGVSEIGFPIGDKFDVTYNPAKTYVGFHISGSRDKAVYVADGVTGWYRMNPTSAPETGVTWSPFATILGGVGCVQSVETAPGVWNLLMYSTGTGQIWKRDLTSFLDGVTPYSWFATIGSIVLAQPGELAEISFFQTECTVGGSHPTLSVLLNEVSGTFEFLPSSVNASVLPPSTSLYTDWFYLTQGAQPAICRHLQLKVSFPAENFQNELLTYTIFGRHLSERG